jgi:hypothetical protein
VFGTANQDTPHIYAGAKPILAIDVGEHAYYLKYQSKRGDYIDAWWNTASRPLAAGHIVPGRLTAGTTGKTPLAAQSAPRRQGEFGYDLRVGRTRSIGGRCGESGVDRQAKASRGSRSGMSLLRNHGRDPIVIGAAGCIWQPLSI